MPLARRHDILRVCERHSVGIVEDDVYRFLVDRQIPPLASLAPDRTTYVTSVSKIIGPGWRIGYVRAPRDLTHRIGIALRATTLMASTLAAEVLSRMIGSGALDDVARRLRDEIEVRQTIVGSCPGLSHALRQPCAFHVWLKLGRTWNEDAFVRAAEDHGVGVSPGSLFEIGPLVQDNAIRICVNAAPSRDVLSRSLDTLVRLLEMAPGQETR